MLLCRAVVTSLAHSRGGPAREFVREFFFVIARRKRYTFLFAWIFLGEGLTVHKIVGGLLIAGGAATLVFG